MEVELCNEKLLLVFVQNNPTTLELMTIFLKQSRFAVRNGKKSPNQETGLGKVEGSERYQIGPN